MIIARNLSLNLGGKVIFNDVSFTIAQAQRVGLVGRNGSGKTTLLKTICAQQGLDFGAVVIEKAKTIAYMPQEVVLSSNKTVLDEALSAFSGIIEARQELHDLEEDLACYTHDPHTSAKILDRIACLRQLLLDHDVDYLIAETKKILLGLGFKLEQFDMPVIKLSVGWKMRLLLVKQLLQKADFYLFDEPTNHLDIVAKDWFFDFLKAAQFGFIIVCHDRFFLDNLCTITLELDRGRGAWYRGNYTTYLEQKEQENIRLEIAYNAQQKMIKHKMEIINKFRAKASKASSAQSMLKALEKIEKIELVPPPQSIRLNFSHLKQPGKIVLKVKDVAKTFEKKELLKHISFELVRGDKAALVAANGVGKTTLLNIITKKIKANEGLVEYGHNVAYTMFEQDQELILDRTKTVLEEIESVCTTSEMRMQVRTLLGTFLFSGDDVDKKISVLSGGEKNRVAMVKVLLQHANVLILDEPTNHLDLESKDILLKALQQFPGTILFVSHDRSFLDGLATKIFELTPTSVVAYTGNYESYIYQKQQGQTEKEKKVNESVVYSGKIDDKNKNDSATTHGKIRYEQKKKMASIERKINSLEMDIQSMQKKLEILEYADNEFKECFNLLRQRQQELEEAYTVWESLVNNNNEQN